MERLKQKFPEYQVLVTLSLPGEHGVHAWMVHTGAMAVAVTSKLAGDFLEDRYKSPPTDSIN